MQPRELVKLYYRIGEVAEIVGVQPHVLRYWESEFRSIRPQKSTKGQRVYSRRDVEKLLRVKDLLKNQGFTIAGARKRLLEPNAEAAPAERESARSERTSQSMRKVLQAIRQDLIGMIAELEAAKKS
jgi:DNA-binding transcriptional MerR regulator